MVKTDERETFPDQPLHPCLHQRTFFLCGSHIKHWVRRAAQPSGSWWSRRRGGSQSWRGEAYAQRLPSCSSPSQASPHCMPAHLGGPPAMQLPCQYNPPALRALFFRDSPSFGHSATHRYRCHIMPMLRNTFCTCFLLRRLSATYYWGACSALILGSRQ